jgi:ferredoxin/predicted transcriptional regulator
LTPGSGVWYSGKQHSVDLRITTIAHDEVYLKLAEKYRLVGDEYFLELLEVFMTPEEGKYLLELATPKTTAEVALAMRLDEATVAAKLDNLTRRGLLFRGQTQYLAWMDAHQLKARVMFSAEEYSPANMIEVRRREPRHISSPYAEIHTWFKIKEMSGHPLIRIIPARKAIAANPNIKPEDVLWYEDMARMMKRANKIGVVDCDCRRIYGNCDKPLLTCLHFGNMVDYEIGRGGRMKAISLEEAIAISDNAEEAGLVHNTPGNNASLSGVICNCCNDCCSTFEPALESGRINEVASPSRFQASVNPGLCKGCQTCLQRCPFGAIEMVYPDGLKKPKASVLADKCLGCGVCVVGCRQGALVFNLVRPPEFIPANTNLRQPLYLKVD